MIISFYSGKTLKCFQALWKKFQCCWNVWDIFSSYSDMTFENLYTKYPCDRDNQMCSHDTSTNILDGELAKISDGALKSD